MGFIRHFRTIRQTVVIGIWVSKFVLLTDFLGLFIIFLRILSTFSSDIDFRHLFTPHKQPSFSNFLCYVQSCFLSGTFSNSRLLNCSAKIYCTVLIDCVLAYYNTQNAFSTQVYGVSTHKLFLNT